MTSFFCGRDSHRVGQTLSCSVPRMLNQGITMASARHLEKNWLAVALVLMAAAVLTSQASAQTVVNGDFEADTDLFVTWPGYAGDGANPAQITGWTGIGGVGINPVVPGGAGDAPFRDNGDNSTSVAFIQGAASIEQDISGFTIGQDYILSLDFNARNCCGDMPIATVELDGDVVASSADIFPPDGAIPPVGGVEPWYHADVDFTAADSTLTLLIRSAAATGGDATLIVDNVSIVPEPATGLLAMGSLLSLVLFRRRA